MTMKTRRKSPPRPAGLAPTCRCEVTGRGPNWLFIHIDTVGMGCGLGERLWRIADQQFTYRIVLDFDPDEPADPHLGVELGILCKRLEEHGGALRLCGLAEEVAKHVLSEADCPSLRNHPSAHDAVWGESCFDTVVMTNAPRQPR